MNILINGGGVENKGAFLMLKAIQQQLSGTKSKTITLLFKPTRVFDRKNVVREGLMPLSRLGSKNSTIETVLGIVPRGIRHLFGLYLRKDVDVFLDTSGFIFGDQWEAKTIKSWFLKDVQFFHKKGAKVIFLPQAFGSFENADVRAVSKLVLEHAELIFARDSISYGHVSKLALQLPVIKQFPDFTNLISPAKDNSLHYHDSIAIIPNQKLFESGKASRSQYIAFVVGAATYIHNKGKAVVFINHSGEKDLVLTKEIMAQLNFETLLINEFDPIRLKQIIGSFLGIVSGRFHGVVSALSQNVPCVATSWSHKYQMLLADYGIENYLLSIDASDDVIKQKLDLILDKNSIQRAMSILQEKNTALKRKSLDMWHEVESVIWN